ncbi:MAG: hypothetical protein CME33_04950 [Gimesia sp.]|nr:hypothetical protein [Gimesia sp.]
MQFGPSAASKRSQLPGTIRNQAPHTHSAGGTVGLPNGEGDHGSLTWFTKHYKRSPLLPADENPEPLKVQKKD